MTHRLISRLYLFCAIRRLGSPKQARQIFAKACTAAKQIDWPEKIFEAWLLFEREHGTVSEYKEALTRSRAAMKTVEHFRAEVATTSQSCVKNGKLFVGYS